MCRNPVGLGREAGADCATRRAEGISEARELPSKSPFCYSNASVSPRPSWLSLEAATMKLLLDRLTASPTPYRFETAPGWWRAAQPARHGLPDEPAEPFVVELRAHRMGEDVYLEGSIRGALEFECSRCLARYRHALPRAVPTRPRARRIARPGRARGRRGAGARRHVPGGRVRDGLVPRRGDRSGRVRAGGDLAVAARPAAVSGGLPRAVPALRGRARSGARAAARRESRSRPSRCWARSASGRSRRRS